MSFLPLYPPKTCARYVIPPQTPPKVINKDCSPNEIKECQEKEFNLISGSFIVNFNWHNVTPMRRFLDFRSSDRTQLKISSVTWLFHVGWSQET